MKKRGWVVVPMLAASLLQGCAYMDQYWHTPAGRYTYVPAAVCAAAGAGIGVGVQEARRGTSTANVYASDGTLLEHHEKEDDAHYWQGALVGAAAGALLCGLVGHHFELEEPPPPAAEPLPPPDGKRIVLRGLSFFDFDKSDIRADSRPVLDEAAAILRENPDVRVTVEGHTDALGGDDYNQGLSERRADAVFRYMVNHGIAPERMQTRGYGESRPVASNATEGGRAQNRRVELHVVNGAIPEE